jgi:hypothetical protein
VTADGDSDTPAVTHEQHQSRGTVC